MNKNINLLQLLEDYAEKMKIQDEAILMQERSKEHKELHDGIQMTGEMYRRRFTI